MWFGLLEMRGFWGLTAWICWGFEGVFFEEEQDFGSDR
jgi:hypothetical protein